MLAEIAKKKIPTTASHRQWFPAALLVQAIQSIAMDSECDGLRPNGATINTAVDLIASVPIKYLGDPEICGFYGEVHISWTRGAKQVVLMCFPRRTPLVHHYVRVPNSPSVHDIEEATAETLVRWLRWMRD